MADSHTSAAYFDTPARAERLQLLLHLIRNVGDVIYLRAPAGAGKTRFTRRLLEVVGDEAACVWLRGGIDNEVAATTASQLGLAAHDVADWPNGVIRALAGQDLLVVVDDADHLGLAAIERLATLHGAGARLLLVGHGGLAQTTRQWDVHYVDLPPFDAEHSATFLRSNAGDEASHINDDLAVFLHHAAHGRPGALLDSLEEVLVRVRRQAEQRGLRSADRDARRPLWPWLAGGVAVVAIAAVLVFQDSINALFEAPPAPPPAVVQQPSVLSSDPQPDAQPDVVAGSAAVAELATPDEPMMPMPMPPALGGMEDSPQVSGAAGDSDAVVSDAVGDDPVPGADGVTPPDISLPELSRLTGAQEEAVAATSRPDTVAEGAPDADVPPADDPLTAVMRDALRAAEPDTVADNPVTGAASPAAPESGGPKAGAPSAALAETGPAAEDAAEAAAKAPTGQRVLRVIADAQPAATPVKRPVPEKPVPETLPAPVSERSVVATVRPAAAPAVPAAPAEPPAEGPAPVEERVAGQPAPVRDARPAPPAAAPVDDQSRTLASAPAAVGPASAAPLASVAASPAPVAPVSPAAVSGDAWLQSRSPAHFTLQLVGARDRAAVEKFIRSHQVPAPYAIFERPLSGSPWYSLVAGDYVDRTAAMAARERLPATLRSKDIWPRSFESIRKSMQ